MVFIYGLELAKSLISTNSVKSALVIGSEKLSAIVDWSDRNTCVLFGDGSGAVYLEATKDESSILDTVMHAQGSGHSYLSIPNGGTKNPFTNNNGNLKLQMDGRAVYNFAVKVLGEVVISLLERNNLTIDDIDWIVPHQANSRIIAAAAKRLNIDTEKFYLNIEKYANTSAASIPIALNEMVSTNLLKKGAINYDYRLWCRFNLWREFNQMVKYGFCFPGQGSQKKGMAIDLYDNSKKVKDLFELASDATKVDIYDLLANSSEQLLQQTENAQLAITVANLSAALTLAEKGITPSSCAGSSLGELSAYASCGVITDYDLFQIVQKRAQLMAKATTEGGKLAMAAVIGIGF